MEFPRKLTEVDLPEAFVNVKAYMKELPAPPLNPATREPVKPEDLAPLFPEGLIRDEATLEPEVPVPTPVLDVLSAWRPTPLFYASELKKALDTPAHIFYKYEGVSPTGSHKPNTAVVQAYYAAQEGRKRLTTETGAGQWGSALSFAGAQFGLEVKVYMVRVSYEQKPGRKALIQAFGANVVPSPSPDTPVGKKYLEENPEHPGSLGIAISEAVYDAANREDTAYSLGSVLDSVLLHQTVIGQEAKAQLAKLGVYPDVVIGCVGGGSNFAGLSFPFVIDRLKGEREARFIAVEPEACPSLTKGEYRYDYGDTAGLTPLLLMHTLGHDFVPPPIHAGGLRYHGMAPLVSKLVKDGVIEARAYPQREVFEAAVLFAKTEGILPAPESAHAVKAAVDEALKAKEEGAERVILFNLSGHGFFDYSAYLDFFGGKM